MTIKSIHVHQKFVIGEGWFNTDSGYPQPVILVTLPYRGPDGNGWKIQLLDAESGSTSSHYLGDMGVKGYAYDDRPCKLVRTLEQAKQTIKAFDDWSFNLDRHF